MLIFFLRVFGRFMNCCDQVGSCNVRHHVNEVRRAGCSLWHGFRRPRWAKGLFGAAQVPPPRLRINLGVGDVLHDQSRDLFRMR
jgi:hypothetical protein